ncbi:antitoxin [Sphingobium herbicidovorans]
MGHEEKYLLIGNVVARHRKPIARCSMSVPIPPPATAPICPPKEGEKDRHRLSGPLSGRGCAPPYDQTRQPILPAIIVAAQPAIVVVAAQVRQHPAWATILTFPQYNAYVHAYAKEVDMARKKAVSVPPREAKLFRNNKSQALRIPADFELPGDRVMIHRDGDRLIIEPVRRKNLLEVLASLQPLGPDDQFPDVEDTLLPIKAIDL